MTSLSNLSRDKLEALAVLKQRGVNIQPLVEKAAASVEAEPIWKPNPGPQTLAFESEADELFYGGAGGGGKTDLLLGCAALNHHRSIIFRRVFPSMRGIIERSREIYNSDNVDHQKDTYNETLHIWRLSTGKVIEFGALQYEKDKENYRGRPHDLYAWDEITEFSESQFRFVNGWNRTTRPDQRCRIIATGNPPSTDDGLWIIKYWGPWLDPDHPNPAVPGELRWFAVLGGKDIECDGPKPIEHEGEIIHPRSRTFIPARLSDNPFLKDSGYLTVLQGLPEPLRSQMLYGDFSLSMGADPWQVIPGAWVRAAQARWTANGGDNKRLDAIGVDVARGGRDKTVIAMRRGNWFAPLLRYPGTDTPSGQSVAGLVFGHVESGCTINVDVIGVGSSVFDTLNGMYKGRVNGVNVAERSDETDKSGKLNFINKRAEGFWKLREALDPEKGDNLALPPDAELLADLTSAKWTLRVNGIQIESKQDIKKRIGRSPDAGDAFVLAFWTNYSVISEMDENIRDLLINYKGY